MILTNARLIFPDGIRDGLEVVVSDGRITELRQAGYVGEKDIVDLAGNYLAPGFVDAHIHGAVGRDTMEGSVEAFRAICDYHASGGTTSLRYDPQGKSYASMLLELPVTLPLGLV